jgi:hypothetical protein
MGFPSNQCSLCRLRQYHGPLPGCVERLPLHGLSTAAVLLWRVPSDRILSILTRWFLKWSSCFFSSLLLYLCCLPCLIHGPHIPCSDVDLPGRKKGNRPCGFQRLSAFTTRRHKSPRWRTISFQAWGMLKISCRRFYSLNVKYFITILYIGWPKKVLKIKRAITHKH